MLGPRAWVALLAFALLSGCLASDDAGSGAGPLEDVSESGAFRFGGALVVCDGQGCVADVPTSQTSGFSSSCGTNATLTATWSSGVGEPTDWFVYVALVGGGTWGSSKGASPLHVDLVPLINGTYQVYGWPAQPFAGPLDGRVSWDLTYQRAPCST